MSGQLKQCLLRVADEAGGPILALDTSGASASVCTVGWSVGAVNELTLDAAAMPSEALVEQLAQRFSESGLEVAQLSAVVVGLGPGSFTGLRVGLATAKGLCMGAGVPLFGASSLATLAASSGPGWIAPVVDARAGEVYGALYRVDDDGAIQTLIEDAAFTPESFVGALSRYPDESIVLAGKGVNACAPIVSSSGKSYRLEPDVALRSAFAILHAAPEILGGKSQPLAVIAPRYLRLSEPERKLRASRRGSGS